MLNVAIEQLSGNEAAEVRQLYATATHKITGRYVANIDTSCQGQWNGKTYHFLEVRNIDHRNRTLEIIAQEEIVDQEDW